MVTACTLDKIPSINTLIYIVPAAVGALIKLTVAVAELNDTGLTVAVIKLLGGAGI